jgi:hypothetical protein
MSELDLTVNRAQELFDGLGFGGDSSITRFLFHALGTIVVCCCKMLQVKQKP